MEHGHYCTSKRGRMKKVDVDSDRLSVKEVLPSKLEVERVEDVIFAPFLDLRQKYVQLASSVSPTKEQLELAKQLLKPSQTHG